MRSAWQCHGQRLYRHGRVEHPHPRPDAGQRPVAGGGGRRHDGAINVGTGGVAIDAGSGALTTGAINAGDAVTLNGGTLSFGRVGAKTLKATATGTLTGGAIATQGDTTLQGRSITAGNVDAVNLSAVTGSDALNLGDLTLSGAAALSGAMSASAQ